MNIAAPLLAAAFGLVAGSFLGLCVYRLPRGLSLVQPGSHCPHCGHALAAAENLPLLSQAVLRGRCRACGATISRRYWLLELGCAGLFAWSWIRAASGPEFVRSAFFLACLLALAVTDADVGQLPDEITLGGALVGLVFALWLPPGLAAATAAALGGAGTLALVAWLYQRTRGRAGMGWGDIKMMALLGAFLGFPGLVLAVFLGSVSAAAAGLGQTFLVLLQRRRRGRSWRQARRMAAWYLEHAALPYGVFLAAGGLAAWAWSPWLLRAWLGHP